MNQRKLVSNINKAADKISNAGVYGSGNFLITNSMIQELIDKIKIRSNRVDKIKKILKDE